MKGIIILLLLLFAATAAAQQNEIAASGGFLGGGAPDPSGAWGLTYSRFLNRTQSLDFSFLSQSTSIETEREFVHREVGFTIQYFQAGGRYTPLWRDSRARPYVSMTLGATRFAAEPGISDARFSIGIGGGANIALSRRISLRFDGRLYTTLWVDSAAIACEPTSCTYFSTGGALYQFLGTGGLVVGF